MKNNNDEEDVKSKIKNAEKQINYLNINFME